MKYEYGKSHKSGNSMLPANTARLMNQGIPQRQAINMAGLGESAPAKGAGRLPK